MKTVEIPLTRGKVALIDECDLALVGSYKWHYMKRGYAACNVYIRGSGRKHQKSKHIKMHRLIMNSPDDLDVDHINHNQLDNRRSNLRNVTKSVNMFNARTKRGASGIRGVSWCKATQRWRAQIKHNGKSHSLGRYDSKEEARLAYIDAALLLFGEVHDHSDHIYTVTMG